MSGALAVHELAAGRAGACTVPEYILFQGHAEW
jgi:hypothetical protein